MLQSHAWFNVSSLPYAVPALRLPSGEVQVSMEDWWRERWILQDSLAFPGALDQQDGGGTSWASGVRKVGGLAGGHKETRLWERQVLV